MRSWCPRGFFFLSLSLSFLLSLSLSPSLLSPLSSPLLWTGIHWPCILDKFSDSYSILVLPTEAMQYLLRTCMHVCMCVPLPTTFEFADIFKLYTITQTGSVTLNTSWLTGLIVPMPWGYLMISALLCYQPVMYVRMYMHAWDLIHISSMCYM